MRLAPLAVAAAVTLAACATTDVDLPVAERTSPTPPAQPSPTPAPAAAPTPEETPVEHQDPPADGDQPPGDPEEPVGHHVITTEDDGGVFGLDLGMEAELRLDGERLWDEPVVDGDAVELAPVQYFQDPGYQAWAVLPRRPGRATIRATAAEGPSPADFAVTVEVTGL